MYGKYLLMAAGAVSSADPVFSACPSARVPVRAFWPEPNDWAKKGNLPLVVTSSITKTCI